MLNLSVKFSKELKKNLGGPQYGSNCYLIDIVMGIENNYP